MNIPNKLKKVVEHFNLTQARAPYEDVEFEALDNAANKELIGFPRLLIEDLYYTSLGPYQLRNAVSYYAEHQSDGIFLVQKFNPSPKHPTAAINYANFEIEVEEPLLIKALMKSRLRSGKKHCIFVLIDRACSGLDAIVEYFCSCESGSRTVVWYLGFGQYRSITIPNPKICNVSISISR